MTLAEFAVRRPIGAAVINLLIIVFGLVALQRLSVREAPDINPPIVSVAADYTGASAEVVEARVTRVLEDALAGIEGIETIESRSRDGQARVQVQFSLDRDIDAAANDVRDRVNRALGDLPEDIDPPEVVKVDENADEVMWLSLRSRSLDPLALTDLVDRLVVDRLTAIDGVAQVNIGGERRTAMRVWLDPAAMAARGVTVGDVEEALRRENVELPAGRLESPSLNLGLRLERTYVDPDIFARLPVLRTGDAVVRLGEVARVEIGPEQPDVLFRANGQNTVGLGIIIQARANLLEVARAVRAELDRLAGELPGGISIGVSYDSSQFVEAALGEVVITLAVAVVLVVAVILLFLGSGRATLIPAVTIPVSLVGGIAVIAVFGFSINLLTLLAFVLATGLVVDDAIVVLENIWRRVEGGEPPREAALKGGRQVFFAVVATTSVLVAVFAPIGLQGGDTGRLFREFALTIAGTVAISAVAALTIVPALSSVMLRHGRPTRLQRAVDAGFGRVERGYRRVLERLVDRRALALALLLGAAGASAGLYALLPQELVPTEDRGGIIIAVSPPEGAGFEYAASYLMEVERHLLDSMEKTGDIAQVQAVVSGGANPRPRLVIALRDWAERERGQAEIQQELSRYLRTLPGVEANARGRPALGQQGGGRPVRFVIGGPTYADLAVWRDRILARAAENPGLVGLDADYDERRPQLLVEVDAERAAELGVPAQAIGATLQTLLGSRNVTTFLSRGEEYEVVLQTGEAQRRSPGDLADIYVRSTATGAAIPLSNLVTLREGASAAELSRFNRTRAVTIEAGLAPGYTLGEALEYLRGIAAEELPAGEARIDYKGESRSFLEAQSQGLFTFGLALVVVFLVLAAQFESVRLPAAVMLTVPLAVAGALLGLWATGQSLNIYSQIGLVMLIGIAAKNGILMVEFAVQLQETDGLDRRSAAVEAAVLRLRPVLMTAVATAAGAVPLMLTGGAGSEVRTVIAVVILSGIGLATVLTLLLLPAVYALAGSKGPAREEAGGAAKHGEPGQAPAE
ncbi:MAG TPA: efflux RND transporter permease subunit [Azospirillaceae bacterium]|nr:efflux RND transporter permease subunit [Azospirillaceae bacterium]